MNTEATTLFYPEQRITLGAYTLTEGISLEVYSSAEANADWGTIRFTKALTEQLALKARDQAKIELGYNGIFHTIFDGYLSKTPGSAESSSGILLKDAMLILERMIITNTFLDVMPQDIIAYCLNAAGISSYKLFPAIYPPKAIVAVIQKNAAQVLDEVRQLWNIPDRFFFRGHTLYFGAAPPQEKIYRFEYGSSILSLVRESSSWVLETMSVPFVFHSDQITVDHPELSGTFKVKKAVFSSNDAGFVQTKIYL